MTGFDLAAGLILLVSGLAGFVRGATREMVTLAAFGAGAAAAVLLLPFSRPIARSWRASFTVSPGAPFRSGQSWRRSR